MLRPRRRHGGEHGQAMAEFALIAPILFLLLIITPLLAVTQEMGMRLTLITRRGLADLIREKFGVKVSLFIFLGLLIANLGTIVVDLAAVNITSGMLGIPALPFLIGMLLLTFAFITWGNYKLTQNIMLVVSLFFNLSLARANMLGALMILAAGSLSFIGFGIMGGLNFVGTVLSGWMTDKVQPKKWLAMVFAIKRLPIAGVIVNCFMAVNSLAY